MDIRYLPLIEYSTKHRVSISTLRRRIKAEEIKFLFEEGKYMILDQEPNGHQSVHRPSQKSEKTQVIVGAKPPTKKVTTAVTKDTPKEVPSSSRLDGANAAEVQLSMSLEGLRGPNNQEPILTAANRLLTELKKAYTQILQEKEEQILILKEEVSDLKTLVRALEAENAKKMRGR